MREKKDKIINLILTVAPLACILLVWQISAKKIGNRFILTDIKDTFKALFALLGQEEFYRSLWGTVSRTLIAFAVSFILASALAFLSRISKGLDLMINPLISVTRSLPTIAVVLLLLLWTNSKIAPIVVTTLVVLPTTYNSMRDAFFSVDNDLVSALKTFNVPTKTLFIKVYAPQVLPPTLLAIGGGLALNLKLMVAAEVLSQTADSLGYLLNTSKVYLEIATMIALVVACVVIGLCVESAFRFVSKKVGKWQ